MAKKPSYRDLDVYTNAFDAAMQLYDLSKSFPVEETHSLTVPILRSARTLCARIATAWHQRHAPDAFIDKLADAASEAAQTQVWLAFAVKSGYLEREAGAALYRPYDAILQRIDEMINEVATSADFTEQSER